MEPALNGRASFYLIQMKNSSRNIVLFGSALLGSTLAVSCKEEVQQPKNLLLITCDDLRTELGCYGHADMISPVIDSLAGAGTMFSRAYCNIAVSGASRSSLLTGTRPTRNTFLSADTYSEQQKPDRIGINEWFHDHGYFTAVGRGKVFHHLFDHEKGWDIVRQRASGMTNYHTDQSKNPGGKRGYPFECLDLPDSLYADYSIASQAIKDLQLLAAQDKPFFYALGFCKPHLPFIAAKRFWDLYDRDSIRIPDNYVLKEGNDIPAVALPNWGELRNNYLGMPDREGVPVDSAMVRTLIHGYHACVSQTDYNIGRVMTELRRLGLAENTLIVLIGDHGWNLGEHGVWCKHSLLETSLHAPMIIVDPSAKARGRVCSEVVEFVDIFPTICDCMGLEAPDQLEGESLRPLLNDPEARSKGWAVCRWQQGYTLVTDDNYFYTEWWDKDDNVVESLLFDHNVDPDENYNVVRRAEYQDKVRELSPLLKARRGADFDKYEFRKYQGVHAL